MLARQLGHPLSPNLVFLMTEQLQVWAMRQAWVGQVSPV
jgi:hypothetical protein